MENKKFITILLLFVFLISFVSARLEIGITDGGISPSIGLDLNLNPLDINSGGNYSINVNSSIFTDNWITDEGVLSNPSDINHNWLSNLLWSVAGHVMDTFLDMNGNNIEMEQGNISDINILNFDESLCSNTDNLLEGDVCWNPDDYTLNVATGMGTVLQVNQETVGIGINKAGENLPDGTVVTASNFQGDRMTFIKADGSNTSESSMIGVLTHDCENNAECFITVFGYVRGLNTSMWTSGDKLYINASNPGVLTNIIPTLPNNPIWVATANVIHQQQGTIFINPSIDPSDGFLINNIYATDSIEVINNVTIGNQLNVSENVFVDGISYFGISPSDTSAATNPGDIGIGGNVFIINATLTTVAGKYGASALFFNNGDDEPPKSFFYLNFSGQLNVTTELFCDFLNDPFTTNDTLNSIFVLYSSEFLIENVYLAINSFENSSCVKVETRIFGDDNVTELTTISYAVGPQPAFGILDNGIVVNGIRMYFNTNISSDEFGSYTRENTLQNKPGGNVFADAFTSSEGDLEYLFGTQTGLNNSGGFIRNSLGVWSTRLYNITQKQNLDFLHNMVDRWFNIGVDPLLDYHSNLTGADLAVEHGIESQQLFLHDDIGNGRLLGEGLFTWIARENTNMEFFNGDSVHIKKDVVKEFGFSAGDNITSLTANFDSGTLLPFVQITSGSIGDWAISSDASCHDGECARALGGTGSPLRSMEANFSSLDQDNLNLSFWITADQASPDVFSIDVNNNEGSGDVTVFTSSATFTDEFQSVILPSSMNNRSAVTVIFNFQGNNPSQDAVYVDDILVVGNATTTTLANVTVEDASLNFGDETCGVKLSTEDGYQDLNITCDNINLISNNGFTGSCIDTIYSGGIAVGCND